MTIKSGFMKPSPDPFSLQPVRLVRLVKVSPIKIQIRLKIITPVFSRPFFQASQFKQRHLQRWYSFILIPFRSIHKIVLCQQGAIFIALYFKIIEGNTYAAEYRANQKESTPKKLHKSKKHFIFTNVSVLQPGYPN